MIDDPEFEGRLCGRVADVAILEWDGRDLSDGLSDLVVQEFSRSTRTPLTASHDRAQLALSSQKNAKIDRKGRTGELHPTPPGSNGLAMRSLISQQFYIRQYSWPIFPCSTRKIPLIKDWGNQATGDLNQIEQWWKRWPDALIAIPTGKRTNTIVVDIDVKQPGSNGFDTLTDDLGKVLPQTPMAHTRSGGLHLYFACNGKEIRNSAGTKGLGLGLDVRGEGGFVVVPSDGTGYWWDPHWNFDTVAPLPAPDWLGHRTKDTPHSQQPGSGFDPATILDEACANIRAADRGHRHDVLNREVFSIAGLAAAGALPEADARHRLSAAAITLVCSTGGDLKKAEKDFADAWSQGLASSRRARR